MYVRKLSEDDPKAMYVKSASLSASEANMARARASADATYAAAMEKLVQHLASHPQGGTPAESCALLLDVVCGLLKHYVPSMLPAPEKWSTFLKKVANSREVDEEFDAMLRSLAGSVDHTDTNGATKSAATQFAFGAFPTAEIVSQSKLFMTILHAAIGGESTSMVLIPIATFFFYFVSRYLMTERYDAREMAKDASIFALLAVALHITLLTGQASTPFWDGVKKDVAYAMQHTPENDPWLRWHPNSKEIRRALIALGDWELAVGSVMAMGRESVCGVTDWTPDQVGTVHSNPTKLATNARKARRSYTPNPVHRVALFYASGHGEARWALFERRKRARGHHLRVVYECGAVRTRLREGGRHGRPGTSGSPKPNSPPAHFVLFFLHQGQGDPNLVLYKYALAEHIEVVQANQNYFQAQEERAAYARSIAAVLGVLFWAHTNQAARERARVGESFDVFSVVEHVFARQ